MNSITLILLLGLIYVTAAKDDDDHNWDYARRGPDVWRHDYKACAGLRQSPINIDPDEVEYDKTLKPFKFHNYDKQFRWNVSHNGHTVVVSKIDNDNVSISGSNFAQPFKLLQFHFHWGYNDYQGSEHYVDQEKYPLEMHLVHQAKNGDITVIGVLFKLVDTDNTKLNPLMNAISHTNFVRNWREVRLNLSSILPNAAQMDSYYRYVGSLTTPPCTENVVWTIMKTFVEISPHQLLSFRTNQVRSNYREPQKIFNRKVTSSFTVQRTSNAKKNNEQAVTSLSSPPLKFNFLVAVGFLAFSTIFSRQLL